MPTTRAALKRRLPADDQDQDQDGDSDDAAGDGRAPKRLATRRQPPRAASRRPPSPAMRDIDEDSEASDAEDSDEDSDDASDNLQRSTYFTYDAASGGFGRTAKRPTNQNGPKVQVKAAERIEEEVSNAADRPKTMAYFTKGVDDGTPLSEMAKGEGLDMAHGVSANEIGVALAKSFERLVAGEAGALDDLDEYMRGFISSDAEESADELLENARRVLSHKDIKAADKIFARMNRTSGNLVGGDPSTNRSLGARRDIPLTKSGRTIRHFQRRAELQDAYNAKLGLTDKKFRPRIEKGKAVSSTGNH